MKKLISILACIAMLMALATSAFAAGIPLGGGTEIEEITTFKAKVDALPEEITLECKDAIEAAEAALAALKLKLGRNWEFGGAKAMAEWVTKLENARADYDTLVAGGGNNDAETPDTPAGGGNADKPAGGNTSDIPAGGGNNDAETPDTPAGGDNADKPAGGDNVDTPTEPETPVEPEKPVKEDKVIKINGAELTIPADKWLYNEAVETATAAQYQMIIFDKNYTGTFTTNGYGCAIVLNQYGELVEVYAGAYAQHWTAAGQTSPSGITANDYATKAWEQLEEGEMLVIFPNDGGSNAARNWALDLRGLKGTNYFGEIAEITGFTFENKPVEPETPVEPEQPDTPAEPETPVEPEKPDEPIAPTGDYTFVVFAMMVLSMTAIVVLVSKKRAF